MTVAAAESTPRKHRKGISFWSGITIAAVVIYGLFMIYPLARLFGSGFSGEGATVAHTYLDFFTKPYYYTTLIHSLVVSVSATVLATIIGAPLAYVVTRFNVPGKLLIRAAVVLTFVSPPFIGAYAWILLLGRNGVLTGLLSKVGLPVPSLYGAGGVILVFTLQALPYVFLLVSSGLKSVDQSLEDASINMGKRPLSVVFNVIAPLIVPAISTGMLLVFVTSFSDFGTPMIIGENYKVLATLIYTEFSNEYGGNAAVASALSVILLVVTIGVLFLQRAFAKRRAYGQETVTPLKTIRLRGWRRAVASLYGYVVVLACCLPLLTIVVSSFLKTKGPLLLGEFSLDGYLHTRRLFKSLFNTVQFSAIATILCVIVGCLVSYVIVRRGDRLASVLDGLSMVPFAVAGIVFGISLSIAFGGAPFFLSGTAVILIIAYFIRRLPYSIRSISGMLSQMGTQTEEASINLGVPPSRTFLKVTVPMLRPAVLSGMLLTFATIAREFNATVILYSGQTRTLPVEVFSQVLQGNFGAASVVGTVLIAVSLIPIVILFWLMGESDDVLV